MDPSSAAKERRAELPRDVPGGWPRVDAALRCVLDEREAKIRRDWIAGELAGRRVPATGPLVESHAAPTLEQAYEAWQSSRVDVAETTTTYQRSAIRRARPLLGRRVDAITATDVAGLVGDLAAKGKSRETIRKTVTVLAMVLDHAGVTPNPARIASAFGCHARIGEKFSPRALSTWKPSTACWLRNTACHCSSSTRPGCASVNSRR